jgi:polyferredoxin
MENKFRDFSTEELKKMKYEWKHCNERCKECKFNQTDYHCRTVYDEIKKEIKRRESKYYTT